MSRWQVILTSVLCTFLVGGLILLLSSRPRGEPLILSTVNHDNRIVYEIYGAVASPGVYHSTQGLRVMDAVENAGGTLDSADSENSGLARRINDGDIIIIPTIAPYQATITLSIKTGTARLNLNLATLEEMMTLPGIGEKKAQDIIDYREKLGGFKEVADLLDIPGFGEKTIEQFYDLVLVE
ncbi:MAG: ComEA family DNA-binding protein [Chloroflexi bacterium]|nr:ComEA family DNA-binding protein [Chloroflexota bacterium]